MMEWWDALNTVAKGFYLAAIVFSMLFLWQLIATLIGMAGSEDIDIDHDADLDVGDHPEFDQDASVADTATMVSFKLLSFRSLLAFFTLFSWAGALYLSDGTGMNRALTYALAWGFSAMIVVAGVFYLMKRLTESGTPRIASCLGAQGAVMLDIPPDGTGEVRVTVSGVLTHVRARSARGQEILAGVPVRVSRVLGPRTVEVEPEKTQS